jgi:hypothetical protein
MAAIVISTTRMGGSAPLLLSSNPRDISCRRYKDGIYPLA